MGTATTPTLEDLARTKFGALTAAEVTLVQRAPDEEIAKCSPSQNPADRTDPANAPAHAGLWGPDRSIRAGLIRWLCVNAEARAHIAPKGIGYDRILEAPSDARSRLKWLRRSSRFGRQPYQQLAKVLRQQGDEAEARKVLVGMEDDSRRIAALPSYHRLLPWLWAWVLKLTINYGYDPLRALFWIAGFVLLGFVVKNQLKRI
jgi:hypothetical protein